ncbi:aldo/keto reductase [Actinomyces sp.]|uniref:aldo/keto reductase n=1 Tax=Actinomyces sp. TaxID=29317 RepID=UPI00289D6FCC|nr:aldo/keto reductase [Actinomyces sp.]
MAKIGTSDLDVAPLCLGGNTFGWTSDRDESHAVLDAFVGGGGNFIDTADVYSVWVPGNQGGESETIIGEWLTRRGQRDDVVVATKVAQHPLFPGLSAGNVTRAANASLTRLRTDHIDLYYAHEEDPKTPVEESVAAFAALQEEGKVRHVALSNFSAKSVDRWIAAADEQGVERPVALQPHYNLVHRSDFEGKLRPTAEKYHLAVIPYWALAAGFLTGKYHSDADIAGARSDMVRGYASPEAFAVVDLLREIAAVHSVEPTSVALRWLALQPTVVAPIASARTVAQVAPLLASLDLTLTSEEVAGLDRVSSLVGR